MNRDFAIIKLTIITVIKSYFFIFIFMLSCIAAFFIPLTVTGSGSMVDLFHIRIDYSLAVCSFLIFISSVWTGCYVMAEDIVSYRIHMLIVKPVPKLRIWIGRFLGVFIIHFLVLILTSFIIYMVLNILSNERYLLPEEKVELDEKVFTGRKSYMSRLDGLREEFFKEFNFMTKNDRFSENEKDELKKKIMNTIIARRGEIKPFESKIFVFDVIKTKYSDNANFTFILYIGSPDILERQNRPRAEGKWSLQINNEPIVNLNKKPEMFISNDKYEMSISLKNLSEGKNIVRLFYQNLDRNRSVFFRITEYPQVQIKNTDFINNLFRCLAIMSFGIVLLSAIGCALGNMFSFPVAVFVIIAYLLFGSLGNFILSESEVFARNNDIQQKIGYSLSKIFLKVVTPVQKFQFSEYVSNGILIENSIVLEFIRKYFLVQFLAISLIGIYAFYKRELGMVEKK